MENQKDLIDTLYKRLKDHNEENSKNQLNLVLFDDAAHHIVKIVRIVSFSLGHALLVGQGGSGRTSLATVSTYIADMIKV